MPDCGSLITLSSIPPRFATLGPTLESLLAQSLAAPVELWIPQAYRRFPDWDGTLPAVPDRVRIRRCAQDWGPATKLVPAVLEALEQGAMDRDILFCDDDNLYARNWHARFQALRQRHPGDALAAVGRHLPGLDNPGAPRVGDLPRMRRLPRWLTRPVLRWQARHQIHTRVPLLRRSGYADLLGGWGGVMVRPGFFAPQLAQGPGDCWPVDDVWLSGMLALGGTRIWVQATILPPRRRGTLVGGNAPLAGMVVDGQGRAALDRGCIRALRRRHGIWTAAD